MAFYQLRYNLHGVTVVTTEMSRWYDEPDWQYETMVSGGLLDGECRRYATAEEAEAGHRETCQLVDKSFEVASRLVDIVKLMEEIEQVAGRLTDD